MLTCRRSRSRTEWHQARRFLQPTSTPVAATLKPVGTAAAHPPERVIAIAEAAFNALRPADAAQMCHTLLRQSPKYAPAFELLARCAAVQGDSATAVEHFRAAADADPTHWQSRCQVAECIVVHGIASGADAMAVAAQMAEQAVAILEQLLPPSALRPRGAALVEERAALIRCYWLLSRTAQALGGSPDALSVQLGQAYRLAQLWLDGPTAQLPRPDADASVRKARLPGLSRTVRVERLARCPLLLRASGLLTESECAYIIRKARPNLTSSEVHNPSVRYPQGRYRSSRTAWVPTADDEVLSGLAVRVAALMQLPVGALLHGASPDSGQIQCVCYAPGQQYGLHHDCNGLLRRYATVLLYLSDCEGGETCFPAASDDPTAWTQLDTADAAIAHFNARAATAPADDGVRVRPRAGSAAIFYNFGADGRLDPRAVHSAMPLGEGEKWIANFWITITPAELMGLEDEQQAQRR